MQLFFCESCGNRVRQEELPKGTGTDERPVICEACATKRTSSSPADASETTAALFPPASGAEVKRTSAVAGSSLPSSGRSRRRPQGEWRAQAQPAVASRRGRSSRAAAAHGASGSGTPASPLPAGKTGKLSPAVLSLAVGGLLLGVFFGVLLAVAFLGGRTKEPRIAQDSSHPGRVPQSTRAQTIILPPVPARAARSGPATARTITTAPPAAKTAAAPAPPDPVLTKGTDTVPSAKADAGGAPAMSAAPDGNPSPSSAKPAETTTKEGAEFLNDLLAKEFAPPWERKQPQPTLAEKPQPPVAPQPTPTKPAETEPTVTKPNVTPPAINNPPETKPPAVKPAPLPPVPTGIKNQTVVCAFDFAKAEGNYVPDNSGNGNVLVLGQGDSLGDGPAGKKALVLTGGKSRIRLGPAFERLSAQLTLDFWVYNEGGEGIWRYIIDCPGSFMFIGYRGGFEFTVISGGSKYYLFTEGPYLKERQWVHVVACYQPRDQRVYIDGKLVTNYSAKQKRVGQQPFTPPSLPVLLGNREDGQRSFRGKIAELKILNAFMPPP